MIRRRRSATSSEVVTRAKRSKKALRKDPEDADAAWESGDQYEVGKDKTTNKGEQNGAKVQPILIKRVGQNLRTESASRPVLQVERKETGVEQGTPAAKKLKKVNKADRHSSKSSGKCHRKDSAVEIVSQVIEAVHANRRIHSKSEIPITLPNAAIAATVKTCNSEVELTVVAERKKKREKNEVSAGRLESLREESIVAAEEDAEESTVVVETSLNTNKILKVINLAVDPGLIEYRMTEPWLKLASQAISEKALIRMCSTKKLVGGHITSKGGLNKVPERAAATGCRAFGVFLRSNFTWKLSTFDEKVARGFRDGCQQYGYTGNQILPHGSYLLNPGSVDPDVYDKTKTTLLYEVQLCERLGLNLYVFHPGSTCGLITTEECCKRIAGVLNMVIKETSNVTILLENTAGQGNTVGRSFEELKMIIDDIEDKSRIGVCLDTCHVFDSGYNIKDANEYPKVMEKFNSIVGFNFLKAVHLNDSKGKCGCRKDRHELIGRGSMGIEVFRTLMNDARFDSMPMILETPATSYDTEIELLYELL